MLHFLLNHRSQGYFAVLVHCCVNKMKLDNKQT